MNLGTRPAYCEEQPTQSSPSRDQLISEHLSLVTAIAANIQRSLRVHVEIDDLIHAGMMGLFDAATKYEQGKDVAFATYAKYRIRGAILDSLRRTDWASRDLRKRYRQMETTRQELGVKLGREPMESEIASAMGLDKKRWQALMVDFHHLHALASQQLKDRDDQMAFEVASPSAENPDSLFARQQLREKLACAIKTLPKRYQQVVTLYYERDMTMKEIGGVLNINESRVSQIHKTALLRMQSFFGAAGIASASALQN
jgi:RNA polymerase sigma factor for flagellar operon FliA